MTRLSMAQVPWDRFDWLNPPASARIVGDDLIAETGNRTDFWRAASGDVRDDGHFFGTPLLDSTVIELDFGGDFLAQFDQAGLMIRSAPDVWVKAGVELAEGELQASVVVTVGRSDWSICPLPHPGPDRFVIRVTRAGEELLIRLGASEGPLRLLRVACPPLGSAPLAGPYCCSPGRAGLEVRFAPLRLG